MIKGLIGIDVGTGSVRGCIFDVEGKEITQPCVRDIITKTVYDKELGEYFYTQSSTDIWSQTRQVVEELVKSGNCEVIGIGFDATCSLVLLDKDAKGVQLNHDEKEVFDVILWRDHRARFETEELNKLNFQAHNFVGGSFSAEMEIPKLMWLKRKFSGWKYIDLAMDMVDFLTFKATKSLTRSVCPLVCKWGWIAGDSEGDIIKGDWETELLETIDLPEIRHLTRGPVKIAGAAVEGGVCASAQLNLRNGTAVGVGLIDAHAGALGIGATKSSVDGNRISIIAGTSTCHMALTEQPIFVPGVWGPYHHAVTKNDYLLEGGQTSAGSTLEWIVKTTGLSHEKLAADLVDKENDLLIIPDFHGNRSPLSNPDIRGSIHSLSIETTPSDLYHATLQGLSLGSRFILETIEEKSLAKFDAIVITGGLTKTQLFVSANANAAKIPVIVPDTDNGVLLGSAMLASVASGCYDSLKSAQNLMSSNGTTIMPNDKMAAWYDEKLIQFKRQLV